MSINHTIPHLARADTLRTASGHIDYHTYDALARRERGHAFRSAFTTLAAGVRKACAAMVSNIGGRRDAAPAGCQPAVR